MHANFMSIFLEGKITERQHGFQPGKGTLTAWKDLIPKIEKYKYVSEIDLKGCFPNIVISYVIDKLKELGVPNDYATYLLEINKSNPKLPIRRVGCTYGSEIIFTQRKQPFKIPDPQGNPNDYTT